MNEELRELRVILQALANQQGLLQWVNGWAYGRNEGGGYVSLFNDRLRYRVCTVYQERFRELPPFIRDNLPEDGDGVEISTDRNVVERKGQLHGCTPFQIARYTVGDGDKAKFVFSGVVRVSKAQAQEAAPAQAQPAPQPTVVSPLAFASMQDAIHYGVQRRVYPDYRASEQAYTALKATIQPTSSAQMFGAWVEQVEGIAATQRSFDGVTPEERHPEGSRKPAPAPPVRRGASGRTAARVAVQ